MELSNAGPTTRKKATRIGELESWVAELREAINRKRPREEFWEEI